MPDCRFNCRKTILRFETNSKWIDRNAPGAEGVASSNCGFHKSIRKFRCTRATTTTTAAVAPETRATLLLITLFIYTDDIQINRRIWRFMGHKSVNVAWRRINKFLNLTLCFCFFNWVLRFFFFFSVAIWYLWRHTYTYMNFFWHKFIDSY